MASKSANDNSGKFGRPDAATLRDFHTNDDVDTTSEAHHHTLGPGVNQSASGAHTHDGNNSSFLGEGVTISGSKGGNAALASAIAAMVQILGVTDSTT